QLSGCPGNHKNDMLIISQLAENASDFLPGYSGIWQDSEGRFPAMPLYEMAEETPEAWNAKAARMNGNEGSVAYV
ncbi:MAG: hypothetical protein RR426_08550, partial [Oscillospiraceae bacterium]